MTQPLVSRSGAIMLDVPRFEQPDDVTCGPTCLTQVYRYFGYKKSLNEVIEETQRNDDGGTLAVYLGISALRNGFHPIIYSYNLRVFDPSWREFEPAEMISKLKQRSQVVRSEKLRQSLDAYCIYLEMGGQVRFDDLSRDLLVRLLSEGQPILTGLSATYLYSTRREYRNEYDDVRGEPTGHFVVISGYEPRTNEFVVRDPSKNILFSPTGRYSVPAERLTSAILLGDVTYDAVLLVLGGK
jgi:hypothetical protein